MSMNYISDILLFADDTSVLVMDDNYDNFKQKANISLPY